MQSFSKSPNDEECGIYRRPPYSSDRTWRQLHFGQIVADLTKHHYERCSPYMNILDGLHIDLRAPMTPAELPYLPVGLFKRLDLLSVPTSDVTHTLTSSGTGGTSRSRIFLDRETSIRQMTALARIITDFVGEVRLPLLILDAPNDPGDPSGYAARAVALQGFSRLSNGDATFALTEGMQPDFKKIKKFLIANDGRKFLLFGFTYVIWRFFFEYLGRMDINLDLNNGVLIHGGGWKRLTDENVDDPMFKRYARERTGLTNVHNYYAMVEQTGSIYMQCEHGFMHCSNFSEIFIRRSDNLSIADCGECGIIQTMSVLPRSYPGHNLLTEDLGVLHGEDSCRCGRLGKYFKVAGRLPSAESKGCGDTYS